PVGVQLVEDQEPKPPGGANQVLPLVRAGQDKVQHHVVGQQDVGRVGQDRPPLLRALLARVAGEGHRGPPTGNPNSRNLRSSSTWLLARAFIGYTTIAFTPDPAV